VWAKADARGNGPWFEGSALPGDGADDRRLGEGFEWKPDELVMSALDPRLQTHLTTCPVVMSQGHLRVGCALTIADNDLSMDQLLEAKSQASAN
jgi:hypothetical protein